MSAAIKVPLAGTVLEPLLVCRALMDSVLTKRPSLVGIVFTETVQQPAAGIELPAGKIIVDPPAVAVTVSPPQVVLALGVAVITTPSGRVSVSGASR